MVTTIWANGSKISLGRTYKSVRVSCVDTGQVSFQSCPLFLFPICECEGHNVSDKPTGLLLGVGVAVRTEFCPL